MKAPETVVTQELVEKLGELLANGWYRPGESYPILSTAADHWIKEVREIGPQVLATITALQAELASARKVVEGLNAHVEAMQGKVVEYLVPEAYAALNGMMASAKDDTTMRDKLFVSDMIYMLDGPEQRDVQTPARDWLAGAAK